MSTDALLTERTAAGRTPAVEPAISVIICTHNRAPRLLALLDTFDAQVIPVEAGSAEVIVVDNNSTDDTRTAVPAFAARARWPVRYLLEQRQGKAYALNTGLKAARAGICLVLDDDQLMPAGYLARLLEIFRAHPDVSFAGGRVLPLWEAPPPPWLTPAAWAPLGMSDYGPDAFLVDSRRLVCLLTFAFRKADVAEVGGFRAELGVSAGRPGSTEDAELIRRLVDSGRRGVYSPDLVLQHHAPATRLTARYYRKWYRGHGRYLALDRDPAIERTRIALAGVPGHMLRAAARDFAGMVLCLLRGDRTAAFRHELQLHQFAGFARQRLADSWRGSPTRSR